MELYYVISVIDRPKREKTAALYEDVGARLVMSKLARGTAKTEHLSMYNLDPTEKVIVSGVLNASETKTLMKAAQDKLYIDIPGNGIMMAIPLKSVAGGKLLSYLSGGEQKGTPKMSFEYELIVVILNEGHADSVMDAARRAGAGGGTVLHAKGTNRVGAQQFLNVSIADEKNIIYIVASQKEKADIMRAINESAGQNTPAGAICFSLPVSSVVGLRKRQTEE